MKKLTFLAGALCLSLLLVYYSCNNPDAAPKNLSGAWRLDSVSHPRDTNRAAMATLFFALAGGRNGIRFDFTADSILIAGGDSLIQRNAYTVVGSELIVRDELPDTFAVRRPTDSTLELQGRDSMQLHLSRIGLR
ncbi:MAG: hypothetical protein EOO16_10695 [Chitinophagaceae bacterium]|nr:MAG: hypothetical protein EOO16_10695 [Chitinophagaceae bacterium]